MRYELAPAEVLEGRRRSVVPSECTRAGQARASVIPSDIGLQVSRDLDAFQGNGEPRDTQTLARKPATVEH
jgi:hypothetical protein